MRQQYGGRRALQHAAVRGGEDRVVCALLMREAQRRHIDRIGQRLGAQQQPRCPLAGFGVEATVQKYDVDARLALPAAARG
ncbi:hypothetical protein D3C73_1369090 [compost metagenome]